MIAAICIGLIIFVLLILLGAIRSKFKQLYNPTKKDNSDYRFINVDNVKTRSIPGSKVEQ